MALHYLETGSTDPAFNLAFEEFVLENRREGDWLMLWQNANSVIVGLNQNAAEEVDPAYVRAHGIRVVRRMTGGGAVYHDLGNLNYSFITDALDTASLSMEALARPCAARSPRWASRRSSRAGTTSASRAGRSPARRSGSAAAGCCTTARCSSTRTRRRSRARSGRTRRSSAPRPRAPCAAGWGTSGLPPGGHGPRGVPSRDPRRADARAASSGRA